MAEAVIVAHPGRLAWEVLAQEHKKISQEFPILDGELHVIVTPPMARCIWHWVSTQLGDSSRVELPVVEGAPDSVEPEPGVGWYQRPLEDRPFQVPVAPFVVIHPLRGANSLLARAFPKVVGMKDTQYLCGWITPYNRELYEKHKTYQDQPDDYSFPNYLRDFPEEVVRAFQARSW